MFCGKYGKVVKEGAAFCGNFNEFAVIIFILG